MCVCGEEGRWGVWRALGVSWEGYAVVRVSSLKLDVSRGLHIAHLNCRSLFGDKDQFFLEIENSNIDCLSLSETWLHKDIRDGQVHIPGYSFIRDDRQALNNKGNTKTGGGLMVYLSNEISYSRYNKGLFDHNDDDIELQMLVVSKGNAKPILLINVYRPPTDSDLPTAIRLIKEKINALDHNKYSEIIMLGDFNVNYRSPNTDQDKLRAHG